MEIYIFSYVSLHLHWFVCAFFSFIYVLKWLVQSKRDFFFILVKTRGWHSNDPAQSCKDIRDSGSSKGDGEYWIDPERSKKPLKVYCDMTTDGGEA